MTKSVNGEHTNWEVIHMHPAKWEHTQEDFWYFWRHSRLLSFSNIFFAKLSSKLKPVKALFLLSFFLSLSLRLCLSRYLPLSHSLSLFLPWSLFLSDSHVI